MEIIESKVPVLVISYNNFEIHACHLDGYKDNKAALLNRLSQIETFFNRNTRARIWYNVDDTILSEETMEAIMQSIARLKNNIVKIAFIGTGKKRRVFNKTLKKVLVDNEFPIAYFSDAQLAKDWLR